MPVNPSAGRGSEGAGGCSDGRGRVGGLGVSGIAPLAGKKRRGKEEEERKEVRKKRTLIYIFFFFSHSVSLRSLE